MPEDKCENKFEKESFYDGYDTDWNEGEDDDMPGSLYKAMTPECYKGYQLRNILGRWVCNKYLKSFETKEELKNFIDTLK